jgi:hypothetical protein
MSEFVAPTPAALISELISVNEAPVALEMLSEALAELKVPITKDAFDEIDDLARGLGLDPEVATRLRQFVES